MNKVTVKKDELLGILRTNRTKHRDIFIDAQKGYKERVIAELEKSLDDARAGKKLRTSITLVAPVNQTGDYDQAIGMLEMSVDNTVELSASEFRQYVLDKWAWDAQFKMSNATYTAMVDADDEDEG